MSGTATSALAGIIGQASRAERDAPAGSPSVRRSVEPPLTIRRFESEDGPAYWRWDCAGCGEYGGGRHHPDAITRAMRHCAEHPGHSSSLLPPARCRDRDSRLSVHPMLFAVDDDPPPAPLSI
ncbi:hypothetical protein [Actinoplanes sp. NPDC051494]|uniref:hypothetical protein n=1 Tax=Actinoplanes sp. NPDC051494 TaxID=3363907 RepID=UPI0037B59058